VSDRYAIIEVFGHTRHVGRVSEVSRYGTTFCQVEPINEKGEFGPPICIGGAAIFRESEVSREIAISAVTPYTYRQLPPVEDSDSYEEGEDGFEDDEDSSEVLP